MADDQRGIPSADSDLYSTVSAEALNEYLELLEDTESPRVFHIWSLLCSVAALLGQNAELRMGAWNVVKPNMFVILIGPPAIKKSTAISLVESMLKGSTLNIGPTDTGGQRHGLMSALTGAARRDFRTMNRTEDMLLTPALARPRRSSDMVLFAQELGRLWGSANREMADFFLDLWDGANISYETKASTTRITKPLVTLLGATTPSSLAAMLPENASSHGILSRVIFVFGDIVHKRVPIPPDPTEEWLDLREKIVERLRWVDNNRRDFELSPSGRAAYESLYEFHPDTQDPRLESYQGRRPQTLLKVAMALCALRFDTWIIESDVLLAHDLLTAIEPNMHRALESFGRNKAYHGRMIIIQFLRNAKSNMAPTQDVISAAASEMTRREAEEVLQAMAANKEITLYGQMVVLGTVKRELQKK